MNIELKKHNIIQRIMSVVDEQVIDQISSEVEELISVKEDESVVEDPITKYSTVIEQEFDFEKIKKEQNYTGIDPDEMDRLVKEADIQEPIEDLLKMI